MSLIKNYAIWNNKGGVGKSTITYHIATRYAETHPSVKVLVIDMCPQANVSMMLLGGVNGEQHVLDLIAEAPSKTIAGFLGETLASSWGQAIPAISSFITTVKDINPQMPSNLLLLCGDGTLELMSSLLQHVSDQQSSSTRQVPPWKRVRLMIREALDRFVAENDETNVAVFIDTNPTFTIYTEMAISSADRLICPVNADDSSRVSTSAMVTLLHGSNPPHPLYSQYTYATQAANNKLAVPQVHVIVGNRMTQYDGAAKAFAAMSDATADTLYGIYTQYPGFFSLRASVPNNRDEFKDEYTVMLRDFNSAGVTTTHLGKLLSQMRQGNYPVHGKQVFIKKDRIDECLSAIDTLLSKI